MSGMEGQKGATHEAPFGQRPVWRAGSAEQTDSKPEREGWGREGLGALGAEWGRHCGRRGVGAKAWGGDLTGLHRPVEEFEVKLLGHLKRFKYWMGPCLFKLALGFCLVWPQRGCAGVWGGGLFHIQRLVKSCCSGKLRSLSVWQKQASEKQQWEQHTFRKNFEVVQEAGCLSAPSVWVNNQERAGKVHHSSLGCTKQNDQ